jgi:hypothetical protein
MRSFRTGKLVCVLAGMAGMCLLMTTISWMGLVNPGDMLSRQMNEFAQLSPPALESQPVDNHLSPTTTVLDFEGTLCLGCSSVVNLHTSTRSLTFSSGSFAVCLGAVFFWVRSAVHDHFGAKSDSATGRCSFL